MARARIGTGCTIAFSTISFTGLATSFAIDGEEVPVLDVTTLGSTGWRQLIGGSLKQPPAVTVQLQYEPGNPPPVGSTVGTITITWPDPDAGGAETAETLTGTGFISSRSSEHPLEDVITGTYVFQFDGGANGGTAPTYS